MAIYYEAHIGRGTFEADTREKLIEKIAGYYAELEEYGYCPDAESVTLHTSDKDGDAEKEMSADWLRAFNKEVDAEFDSIVEDLNQPSDYEEHNTHWGL